MYFYLLYKHRSQIKNRLYTSAGVTGGLAMIAFLFEAYSPTKWYFEIIDTTRRLFQTSVIATIAPGSSSQMVLAIIQSFAFLQLYSVVKPYSQTKTKLLVDVGQAQILFVYFFAMVVKYDLLTEGLIPLVDVIMILIGSSVVTVMIYFEYQEYGADLKREDEHEKSGDDNDHGHANTNEEGVEMEGKIHNVHPNTNTDTSDNEKKGFNDSWTEDGDTIMNPITQQKNDRQ